MKKIIALLLALSLLALCGCGGNAPEETTVPTTQAPVTEEPTTAPTTVPPTEEPTEAPTEAPTEPPVPTNPLTGETLEAPMDTRPFAVVINNVHAAIPMYGVSKADIFFEMYVNDLSTRGLALYADIREVGSVGSVRSLRFNFIDLAQMYDLIMVHANASKYVTADAKKSGIDRINAGSEYAQYYFWDTGRQDAGYAQEHCFFIKGPEIYDYAQSKDIRVTAEEDRDYGLSFAETANMEGGESANRLTINLTFQTATKRTVMKYNEEQGTYLMNQYNLDMYDASEKQNICFKNVLVLLMSVENEYHGKTAYHVADMIGSGEGYYACEGKIIPIKWSHDSMDEPFRFTYADGTPLELAVGNSYIALAPLESTVEYE